MKIEEPNKANDLERTIEAIHESRVIVGHTLSTVSFQGDPQLLVIDELQFVLRPAAVTLDHGDDLRGNVIPEHRKLLSDQKASPAQEPTTFAAYDGSVSIQYQRFEFSPLGYVKSETPLLNVLIAVSVADEFRIDDWTLTLYYNGHSKRGPEVCTDDGLREAFLRHFASSVKHLSNFRPANSQGRPLGQRFPTLIAKSPFLRLVLKVLRDQILAHLQKVDPQRFAEITASPFALQYFLVVGTDRTDRGPVKDPHLCYFPLEEEVEVLEERKEVLKKAIAVALEGKDSSAGDLPPVDFIRRYPWEAARSLIGYTFATGAARYFPDWTTELIVQAADYAKESVDRNIATVIMQTMREDTKHQFNIPLYAGNEILGAIIVNTKDIIPWDAQVLPVWCARQVGGMIDSALTMDPQVNDMARKIADAEARANQVRTYKHMLHSLVHHEGSYCDFLERLIEDLGKTDVPEVIRGWKALVEYTCDDRRQLVSEFQNAPVNDFSGEANAVLAVAPTDIFDRHQVDISVAQITTDLAIIERLFDSPTILIVKPPVIGPMLLACGALPSLKPQVLRRIFSNLYRNTLSWAQIRGTTIKNATLEFFLEVNDAAGATELTVVARDNCGGIGDAAFPFGSIRVQAWLDYLNDLEKRPRSERKEVRGMGFLTIARYAEATGGEFTVRNWSDDDVMGTEITIRLRLKTESP